MHVGAEAVVVPADPPRQGVLALWGDAVRDAGDSVELVLPAGSRLRRTRVPARCLAVGDALPLLLEPPGHGTTATLRGWSDATLAGLDLVGRGRLLPARTPQGHGAWRVAPLDAAARTLLADIAAALPPQGHALPVHGTRPLQVSSPHALVRAWWDALADTLVRTSAAPLWGAEPLAALEPAPLAGPDGWLAEAEAIEHAGATLVLRIEPPGSADDTAERADEGDAPADDAASAGAPFTGRLLMRSSADPSLLVDVADLWTAPAAVLSRLGARAEVDLLLALRRGSRAWPPLAPALTAAAPTAVDLEDESVEDLFAGGGEALGAAGVEVLWPAELLGDGLGLRASAHTTPTPAGDGPSRLSLDELLEFRWRPTLDGESLTADEINVLASAKRPLVRMRGRWLRADPDLLDRLRRGRRPQQISLVDALAAGLTGELQVGGEQVEFAAGGGLADVVERLTSNAGAVRDFDPPEGLHAVLRPYQRTGVAWMAHLADIGVGAVLADDMGLGKTVQLIALHLHRRQLGLGPTLVVCPTSLLGTWRREVARFAPGIEVRRFHGTARSLDDVAVDAVVVTTYGVIRRDHARLAGHGWGLVVADEAQHAKNPLSRTGRALRTIPGRTRIALTGTPVENRLSELWAVLDWTTPGILGQLEHFRHTFGVPVERYHDPDATARLTRLTRPFLLRRKKSDPNIAPELPAKTESDLVVPLTAEQATLYQAVVDESISRIERSDGIARRGMVLALLTGLKQVCNHPAHYLKESGPLPGRSGKLTALDELLDVILAEGESVLIFSQYVAMCRLLERHLASRDTPTLLLHGGVGAPKRERMVAEFQSGAAPVLLLSLKAGGVGLTLTRATHVVHYDRWWNPAVEDQATDRAYRIGQDRPVQVHRLVTEATVEDRVAAVIAAKRELVDAVVGAGEGWLTGLSDAELSDLVRLGDRR